MQAPSILVWAAVLIAVLGAWRPAPAARRPQGSSASTTLTVTPPPTSVPGTLTTFSPTVLRVTVGAQQCTVWAHLPGVYDTIVGCYDPGVVAAVQIEASGSGHMNVGYFDLASGPNDAIDWLIKANADGSQSWQMAWTVGAAVQKYSGTFAAPVKSP